MSKNFRNLKKFKKTHLLYKFCKKSKNRYISCNISKKIEKKNKTSKNVVTNTKKKILYFHKKFFFFKKSSN